MRRLGLFLLLSLAFGVAIWLATGGPSCLTAEADPSLSIFIQNGGTAPINGVAYRVHNIPPFVPLLNWTSIPPGQTSTQFIPALANTTYDVRVLYAPPGVPPTTKTKVVVVGTTSVTATFTGP